MTKSGQIAQIINKEIKSWSENQDKLIVVIDGYSGTGKSTIVDLISKINSNVLPVHLDDFILPWEKRKDMIEKSKNRAKVFEYGWYRYKELAVLVKGFKTKRKGKIKINLYDYDKNRLGLKKEFDLSRDVMILEGIFLLHPLHKINKLWDKRIYLNANLLKADKKRIAREKKKWGKLYIPEDHPDNWTKYYKIAYKRYIKKYKPPQKADLVFKV